ncbi:MAG TPA: sigma 54-interacting transcriptional regulator, partial [Spirochaetia bacterium]|nr:sigma 54-interacting transcriptional regulator [Spirochaetia bacterium]
LEDIAGESEAVRRAKRIATRLAATDLSILIHGESGTGKELFASAIHAASARSAGPFLAVDLGALSDDLVESELFGYEEGAFTGAKKGGKTGLFELADGGTLFLDEIGNVSPKVQTRLLRVLQEKEVMRVGGADLKRVDVRVIAATNEDLLDKARKGQFREDLYFRLKMGWLRIPPLRERRQDIPRLVRRILEQEGAGDVAVSPEVLAALESRDWPGNVRELRNALTYMLAVREDREISAADLPEHEYFAPREAEPYRPALSGDAGPAAPLGFEDRFVLGAVAELEAEGKAAGRDTIAALARARGLGLGTGAARSRLERLAALGLLVMGRGRRGSRLTAEGRRAVRSVH